MHSLPGLLIGTVLLRPYVFVFLAVYIFAGTAQMGLKRTIAYIPLGYALAWLSEFSSIHWGFPYGDYFYIPSTIDRELWVFGVPFMDSLSYVFLSYCGFSMAVFLLSPLRFAAANIFLLETHRIRRSMQVLVLGGFLTALLDIIIDPVALQGHRWFLGQIYGYRQAGLYFGIPMSNFGGWLLVGFILTAALQYLDRLSSLEPRKSSLIDSLPGVHLLGPILYLSVIVFNLIVTFRIGEELLGIVGCLLVFFPLLFGVFFTLYKQANLTRGHIEEHLHDFPLSGASRLLSCNPDYASTAPYLVNVPPG